MSNVPRVDTSKHPNVSLFDITEEFIETADKLIDSSANSVSDYWKQKYERDNSRNWDKFYKHNQSNFFKDRHYLVEEFSLNDFAGDQSGSFHVVDMGCGVGNALLPLLHHFPKMSAKGFDCSATAINLLQQRLVDDELSHRCQVNEGDMTDSTKSYEDLYNTADFVLLLFVQSAIDPSHYDRIRELAWRILKPGGILLFRDYGKYDMAQLRFEASSARQGNRISKDFYVRGDGTRAKFFTVDELRMIYETNHLFRTTEIVVHNKQFVNRKTDVVMKRIWIQGKWTKVPK